MVNMAGLFRVEVRAEDQEVIGCAAEVAAKGLQIPRVGDYLASGGIQAGEHLDGDPCRFGHGT